MHTSNISEHSMSRKQQLFTKYLMFVLVDLTVLNFFAEYWDRVTISSFGVSLLVAIILQVLLKMTLQIEHKTAAYFKSHEHSFMKVARILSTWFILFVSKLVMLGILQYIFAGDIHFAGAYHGVVAFIVLVIVILVVEALIARLYNALA